MLPESAKASASKTEKTGDEISVPLSSSQIDNLIQFIEFDFIDSIRDDEEIDNIDYIVDMMDALKALRKVRKTPEGDNT